MTLVVIDMTRRAYPKLPFVILNTNGHREKARIPAWCDRILWKGKNLRQLSYDCAPLRFSDHRPVYATFRCTVRVVDEPAKEKLSKQIYLQRKSNIIMSITMNSSGDEDNLLVFEPVAPGCAQLNRSYNITWLTFHRRSTHTKLREKQVVAEWRLPLA